MRFVLHCSCVQAGVLQFPLRDCCLSTWWCLSAQNQESWPNRAHTRRKSCYTPKASSRGERLPPLLCWFNSPPTINVGLIPTISPVTHWCPLALTRPTPQSTSDRLHTRAHMSLTPAGPPLTGPTHEHTRASHPQVTGLRAYTTQVCTGTGDCGPSSDTNCWPKTGRVGPTGTHPEEILLHPKS